MIAIALLLCIPVIMWVAQSAALKSCGMAIRLPLDSSGAPPVVRKAGRVVTQLSLAGFAIVYPLLRSENIAEYYNRLLPLDHLALDFVRGGAMTTLFLSALFLVWIAMDQMRVAPHLDRRRTMRRIAIAPLSAVFGATVEEIVFRGIVMADLLRSPEIGASGAVAISAVVFAGAHYVRSVKRHWTLPGHIMLGLLLSVAFLKTGNLWLAIGLHAGGILMIMGARPILKYRGPAWLNGASIYPYSGIIGIVGLATLMMVVARF